MHAKVVDNEPLAAPHGKHVPEAPAGPRLVFRLPRSECALQPLQQLAQPQLQLRGRSTVKVSIINPFFEYQGDSEERNQQIHLQPLNDTGMEINRALPSELYRIQTASARVLSRYALIPLECELPYGSFPPNPTKGARRPLARVPNSLQRLYWDF